MPWWRNPAKKLPCNFKRGKLADLPRTNFAEVVETEDTLALGASTRKSLWVQIPPSALAKFSAGRTSLFIFSKQNYCAIKK